MLPSLILVIPLLAVASAEHPLAFPGQRPALPDVLQGTFQGLPALADDPAVAWLDVTPLLGGAWYRLSYRSSLAGDRGLPSQDFILRVLPDRSVQAWAFRPGGARVRFRGRLTESRLQLRAFDESGALLEWVRFAWSAKAVALRVRHRAAADAPLTAAADLRLRPSESFPREVLGPAVMEQLEANPYAYYWGRFEGQESSPQGESSGFIHTEPVLGGAWFLSEYHSRAADGSELYAGIGYTHCTRQGAMSLDWFDQRGESFRLQGTVGAEGCVAYLLGPDGSEVERHTDSFTPAGYRFRIEERAGGGSGWRSIFEADYRRARD